MFEKVRVGDKVADSPVGAGKITGISDVGHPQVNDVTVGWVLTEDGVLWDPNNKSKPKTIIPAERIPTHPGAILRDDVLPSLKMSIVEFSEAIKIPRQLLYGIINEHIPITPSVALRLGKFLSNGTIGPDASFWLRMQSSHDLAAAEKRMREELKTIIPYKVSED